MHLINIGFIPGTLGCTPVMLQIHGFTLVMHQIHSGEPQSCSRYTQVYPSHASDTLVCTPAMLQIHSGLPQSCTRLTLGLFQSCSRYTQVYPSHAPYTLAFTLVMHQVLDLGPESPGFNPNLGCGLVPSGKVLYFACLCLPSYIKGYLVRQ